MKSHKILRVAGLVTFLGLLAFAGFGQATLPSQKKAAFIVNQFKNKLKTTPYIAYNFDYKVTGKEAATTPNVTGMLKFNPHPKNVGEYQKMLITGKSTYDQGKDGEQRSFSFASDQTQARLYLPKYQLMLTTSLYKHQFALFGPFVGTLIGHSIKFFQRDIASKVRLIKEVEVNGQSCYQVGYESNGTTLRWSFGKQNFMLYQVKMQGNWGGYEINYTQVITQRAIPAQAFQLQVPKGVTIKQFSAGQPTTGETAPAWDLPDYEGNRLNLNSLKGKVVVMDFWATWCPPCIKAIPGLQKLHEKYEKQGVKFLGLAYRDQGKPLKFMKKRGVTYTILNAQESGKAYGVSQWPTLFIIGRDGKIRDYMLGYHGEVGEKILEKAIEDALKDKPLPKSSLATPNFDRFVGQYKTDQVQFNVFKNKRGKLSIEHTLQTTNKSKTFPLIHLKDQYFTLSGDLKNIFEFKIDKQGKIIALQGFKKTAQKVSK
ncbi:MAG TPA: hypothetical protein DCS93_31910 [Microscillaceae bacterium]|nr:hypothetical protein [Microscillaceae bacterium]